MSWREVSLKEVAAFDPAPLRRQLTEDNPSVAFMPMAAVDASRSLATTDQKRPAQEVLTGYTYFQSGDVLVAKITPCFENGKIALAQINQEHGFGTTEFHVLRAFPDRIDAKYLTHFLRQSWVIAEGERKMTGSAGQRRIPRHFLEALRVPLPSIEEQRRVTSILDQAEALRAKRRQALAKLDTLTQSIFLEMFGDPSANHRHFPVLSLGELFDEPPCYGTMVPGGNDGKWLVLRVANIQDWEIDLSSKKYVDLPSVARSRHTVRDGDIVLARAIASLDHLGKGIVVRPVNRHWAFDSHLMRIRLQHHRIVPEYLVSLLQTEGGRSLFLAVTRRSAVQYNVNTKEIASLRIPVPDLRLQQDFVALVRKVAAQRCNLVRSIEKDNELWVSLSAKAFTGGI